MAGGAAVWAIWRWRPHGPPPPSQMHPDGNPTAERVPEGRPDPGPKRTGYSTADGPVPGADDWAQVPAAGPGYEVRRPERTWGTKPAVASLVAGLDRYHYEALDRGMDAPDVRIGDMSREGGGPFPPHVSHQRGRDVDMSWRGKLPVPQTAVLLMSLLGDDNVGAIFVDQTVQRAIWDAVQADPELAPDLATELQYPLAAHSGRTRVRHWPGHKNHIHVRFRE